MEQQSFGYWLRLRRKGLDLTREGLADRVGCSVATIRKVEAEERRPSAQIVERLAEVFKIPQDERAAFLRFARGDWGAAPGGISEAAPWRASTTAPRSNLPASLTSLIGREQDVAAVCDYLSNDEIRLVTLIGPPGIGKTRLSIEAARAVLFDFPDGVFFVALAPLADPSLIAPAIVQTLGYVEAKNLPASQRLMDGIEDKQMLLVLDNLEHLIDGSAALITDLLLACPRLKILTTSREALRVPGEWLFPVPPLDVPEESQLRAADIEAVSQFPVLTLFAERARAVQPDFSLSIDNLQAVAAICAQLDGLPLAIELISARIRLMSPQSLLSRLSDDFTLHADGMHTLPARQKTLHDAIAWSYDLLSQEEKGLFARLPVFAGGFTLEAAELVFSRTFPGQPVSDLVASLLDKSLLQHTCDARGEPRFNMLVTIQQFARDCLSRSGEEVETHNWHLAYFLDLAEKADREIHGPHQVEWMDRLDMELDNFRAALDWCLSSGQTEQLLRLFAALGWTWLVRWSPSESRSWLHKIRALPDLADYPAPYAQILITAMHQEWVAANPGEVRSLGEESRAICLKLGADGERGLAGTLSMLGLNARSEGDLRAAAAYLEQSFELYQKCGDRWGMAYARAHSGLVAYDENEDTSAFVWLRQSLDLFRELDDPWGMARSSQFLGQLFLKQGLYEEARVHFDQHLRLDEALHFKEGIAIALANLGDLYRHQGDYDQAEQYYEKSLSICREYGLKIDRGYNLFALGMLALHRNNYPLARRFFTDYYNSSCGFADKVTACDLCTGLSAVAAGRKQPERAGKLYGAAQAIFETTDYRIPPFDRAEFERHIGIAREQLGETRFEALAAEGRTMTVEKAVAYALQEAAPR